MSSENTVMCSHVGYIFPVSSGQLQLQQIHSTCLSNKVSADIQQNSLVLSAFLKLPAWQTHLALIQISCIYLFILA